jgi:hypothetical protein
MELLRVFRNPQSCLRNNVIAEDTVHRCMTGREKPACRTEIKLKHIYIAEVYNGGKEEITCPKCKGLAS